VTPCHRYGEGSALVVGRGDNATFFPAIFICTQQRAAIAGPIPRAGPLPPPAQLTYDGVNPHGQLGPENDGVLSTATERKQIMGVSACASLLYTGFHKHT
jgi:hypothetical protein